MPNEKPLNQVKSIVFIHSRQSNIFATVYIQIVLLTVTYYTVLYCSIGSVSVSSHILWILIKYDQAVLECSDLTWTPRRYLRPQVASVISKIFVTHKSCVYTSVYAAMCQITTIIIFHTNKLQYLGEIYSNPCSMSTQLYFVSHSKYGCLTNGICNIPKPYSNILVYIH